MPTAPWPGTGAGAWVYEPGSFRPLAKLQGEDLYYVVTDHIGTPRELIFGWHGYRVVSVAGSHGRVSLTV